MMWNLYINKLEEEKKEPHTASGVTAREEDRWK